MVRRQRRSLPALPAGARARNRRRLAAGAGGEFRNFGGGRSPGARHHVAAAWNRGRARLAAAAADPATSLRSAKRWPGRGDDRRRRFVGAAFAKTAPSELTQNSPASCACRNFNVKLYYTARVTTFRRHVAIETIDKLPFLIRCLV